MPSEKPRFTVIVDEELLNEIDDFRFENRYTSRSAAALDLLRKGIEQIKKEQAEKPEKSKKKRTAKKAASD